MLQLRAGAVGDLCIIVLFAVHGTSFAAAPLPADTPLPPNFRPFLDHNPVPKTKPIFDPHVTARFSWSRHDRYGLDMNNDGIIDLPNTYEYAYNLPSWSPEGCGCFNGDCATGGP